MSKNSSGAENAVYVCRILDENQVVCSLFYALVHHMRRKPGDAVYRSLISQINLHKSITSLWSCVTNKSDCSTAAKSCCDRDFHFVLRFHANIRDNSTEAFKNNAHDPCASELFLPPDLDAKPQFSLPFTTHCSAWGGDSTSHCTHAIYIRLRVLLLSVSNTVNYFLNYSIDLYQKNGK